MVMSTPSPQQVGREFVRQYYTLLHEAPLHLHRFYSEHSTFTHGGIEKPGEEEPPAIGQHEIHKKITSLNFRDCHTKIQQVDSHSTLGSGVVVQVTGELSNNRQPMRRFMQTFVLAPQSPKKYYVHNDIFRYQDEVFSDHESEEDADSEGELESPQKVWMNWILLSFWDSARDYFHVAKAELPGKFNKSIYFIMHTLFFKSTPLFSKGWACIYANPCYQPQRCLCIKLVNNIFDKILVTIAPFDASFI